MDVVCTNRNDYEEKKEKIAQLEQRLAQQQRELAAAHDGDIADLQQLFAAEKAQLLEKHAQEIQSYEDMFSQVATFTPLLAMPRCLCC